MTNIRKEKLLWNFQEKKSNWYIFCEWKDVCKMNMVIKIAETVIEVVTTIAKIRQKFD